MTDSSLQQEMTRVAGALYALGGLLLGIATIAPTWEAADRPVLLTYAGLALATAVALEVAARRHPLSTPQLMAVAVAGIAIVTGVVVAGGPDASGALAVFYVFVLAYGFYYLPSWWAITEVALVGATYAWALAHLEVDGASSQWLLVTGTYAAVGAILGTIGQRVRDALEAEVRASQRLRELDELKTTFLRAVSHELRTPLTNVVGYVTTLRAHRGRLSGERVDELLDRAAVNAQRLEQLLVDLLDLDRVARGILAPNLTLTDVGLLALNVADQLDFQSHPFHVDAHPVEVAIDASKVERIIENLLGNAIKHTQPDSQIWLTVREHEEGVLVRVEDDGPGVPDELKQALFEPFAQGPASAVSPAPGTGIGLSLVWQFTQLHDGRVWIADSPYGGACFNVLLPHGEESPDGADGATDDAPGADEDGTPAQARSGFEPYVETPSQHAPPDAGHDTGDDAPHPASGLEDAATDPTRRHHVG